MSDYDPDESESDDTEALERAYEDVDREELPAGVELAYDIWVSDPEAVHTPLEMHQLCTRVLRAYLTFTAVSYEGDDE